jgi:hypothetical protein
MELQAMSVLQSMWSAWERFWFTPVPATSLGWMRVSLGAMLVGSWLLLWPDVAHILDILDARLIDGHVTDWRFSHLDLVSGPWVHVAHAAALAVFVAFMVGWKARWMNLAALIVLIGFWHRMPWVQNGGDRLLRIWTLYMLAVPSGAAVSVDAWLSHRRGEPAVESVSGFTHRLVQLQLCFVYTYTGIDKLLSGAAWRDGTAIYYSMSEATFSRAPWLLDPILQTAAAQYALMGLTWATLAWEVFFPALVLWRRTRLAGLVAGVGLHMGIFFTMSVGIFGPASVWGYQAFLADRFRQR